MSGQALPLSAQLIVSERQPEDVRSKKQDKSGHGNATEL
jgi:hypothetical protein